MNRLAKIFLVAMVMCIVLFTVSSAMAAPADTYKAKCAMCHGADGKGDTAMGKKYNLKDLASADVQGKSDAQLTEIITKGKDKMPAYSGKLSDDEIKGLVGYIRTLKK
jgi:mono/diheme cytochrome c family protein